MYKYPALFSKDARNFGSGELFVLPESYNICVKEVINGEFTLCLNLPFLDKFANTIIVENIIYARGQPFRIKTVEQTRKSDGAIEYALMCEHISYDINTVAHLPNVNGVANVTAMDVFVSGFNDEKGVRHDGILQNTGFTFQSDINTATDLFLSKTNPRAILTEFINKFKCEVIFDNFLIKLVAKRGNANPIAVKVGKNVKELKKMVDSSGVITRLYPYGASGLDITAVNDGIAYIDSPKINDYNHVKSGFINYTDLTVPQDIKDKALLEWASATKSEGLDVAKITYEVTLVELKKLAELGRDEAFAIGDKVHIVDDFAKVNVYARIVQYEEFPYEPKQSLITLANFTDSIESTLSDLVSKSDVIDKITNEKDEVYNKYVEGIRDTMTVKFNSALNKKTVVYDYANMWVDNVDNPTCAIALVDGMFAMANTKTATGDWNWRTLGDSSGFVADRVNANWVYAGQVAADKVTAGALHIVNGDINITNADGSKTEITANGVKVIHRAGDYTLLNKYGVRRYINEQVIPLCWLMEYKTAYDVKQNADGTTCFSYVLLPGTAWKEIAQAYGRNPNSDMLKYGVLSGTVPDAGNRMSFWEATFSNVRRSVSDTGIVIIPTDEGGSTVLPSRLGESGSTTIIGHGAIMCLTGRAGYNNSSGSVIYGVNSYADVKVCIQGSPDFIGEG